MPASQSNPPSPFDVSLASKASCSKFSSIDETRNAEFIVSRSRVMSYSNSEWPTMTFNTTLSNSCSNVACIVSSSVSCFGQVCGNAPSKAIGSGNPMGSFWQPFDDLRQLSCPSSGSTPPTAAKLGMLAPNSSPVLPSMSLSANSYFRLNVDRSESANTAVARASVVSVSPSSCPV